MQFVRKQVLQRNDLVIFKYQGDARIPKGLLETLDNNLNRIGIVLSTTSTLVDIEFGDSAHGDRSRRFQLLRDQVYHVQRNANPPEGRVVVTVMEPEYVFQDVPYPEAPWGYDVTHHVWATLK